MYVYCVYPSVSKSQRQLPNVTEKSSTMLSPIRHGFAPGFVNYEKGCTRLAATRNKVYQLLTHGRWFSPGTPASSTTWTCRHDIAEILLKVALDIKKSINQRSDIVQLYPCIHWHRQNIMFHITFIIKTCVINGLNIH
jgi:hypothetical protein